MALMAMPDSSSPEDVLKPDILETKTTSKETMKAPTKAQTPMDWAPKQLPTPKKIAIVAPSEAPEDTPKI